MPAHCRLARGQCGASPSVARVRDSKICSFFANVMAQQDFRDYLLGTPKCVKRRATELELGSITFGGRSINTRFQVESCSVALNYNPIVISDLFRGENIRILDLNRHIEFATAS